MDSSWLSDMFVLSVPWLEKVLRPVIVYVFLIIGLRIAGKRELAQLNPFDLVVLLTLSNTVQNAIIGSDNSVTGGVLGAATLLAVNYVVVRFVYSHRRLEEVVEGKSDRLIFQGTLNQKAMKAELITLEELEAAARKQGIASLAEVESATIETGGAIDFILREPALEEKRHREMLRRMDELAHEIRQLKTELNSQRGRPGAGS